MRAQDGQIERAHGKELTMPRIDVEAGAQLALHPRPQRQHLPCSQRVHATTSRVRFDLLEEDRVQLRRAKQSIRL
jgi:hypothetical protein